MITKGWRGLCLQIEGRKQAEGTAQAQLGQQTKLDHEGRERRESKGGAADQERQPRLRSQETSKAKMTELYRDQGEKGSRREGEV